MTTLDRAALLLLLALASCNASREGDKITVELDASEAKAKAKEAGQEIRAGAHEAGAALNAGKQELDIRSALAMDGTVDRSAMAVVPDEATRTIRLMGSVPTAEQRTRVEQIARDKAEGWVIVNELAVAPAAAAPASSPAGATAAMPAGVSLGLPTATAPVTPSAP
jgi:hypothetical protein